MILNRPWEKRAPEEGREGKHALKNPFEFRQVIGFGLLLAVIIVLTRALTEIFGVEGGIAFAAIAGLADVDAITLSMTRMAGQGTLDLAATAILVAAAANSLSKSGLALFAGGRAFGLGYLGVTLASLAAAGATALVQPWS